MKDEESQIISNDPIVSRSSMQDLGWRSYPSLHEGHVYTSNKCR